MMYLNISGRFEIITKFLFFRRETKETLNLSVPIEHFSEDVSVVLSPRNSPIRVSLVFNYDKGLVTIRATLPNSTITLYEETFEAKKPEAHLISRWTPIKGVTIRDLKVSVTTKPKTTPLA